jgi:hypothetical protein
MMPCTDETFDDRTAAGAAIDGLTARDPEERTGLIDRDNPVPQLNRRLLRARTIVGPRVVHKNVDRPEGVFSSAITSDLSQS